MAAHNNEFWLLYSSSIVGRYDPSDGDANDTQDLRLCMDGIDRIFCYEEENQTKGEIRMKRYINWALLYTIFAMVGGVFYREFTKFNGFTGKTTLTVVHTHYFVLGMAFFLLMLLLEKNFSFTNPKTGRILALYHIGLNLTSVMFVVRGITQVLNTPLSSGMSAAISGIAGIGHILLGISQVFLLLQIKGSISEAQR